MIRQKNEEIKLHLGYKCGFSFSKLASRLQKLRFVYKYSVVHYKDCISFYKVASRLSIKQREKRQDRHVALLLAMTDTIFHESQFKLVVTKALPMI